MATINGKLDNEKGLLTITLPLRKGKPSSTGKNMVYLATNRVGLDIVGAKTKSGRQLRFVGNILAPLDADDAGSSFEPFDGN